MINLKELEKKAVQSEYITHELNSDRLWEANAVHSSGANSIKELYDNIYDNINAYNVLTANTLLEIKEFYTDNKRMIELNYYDTGTGMQDLVHAFTLSAEPNEVKKLGLHGKGQLSFLSFFDIKNNNWEILTRTEEDIEKREYKVVKSKYNVSKNKVYKVNIADEPWPSKFKHNTGTIVRVITDFNVFSSVADRKGIKTFDLLIDYLVEELRVTYSPILSEMTMHISAIRADGSVYIDEKITNLDPNPSKTYVDKKNVTCILREGEAPVNIDFKLMEIHPSKENKIYYRGNPKSAGVEIRIEGRLITSCKFGHVYDIEDHPSYNRLIAQVNIKTKNMKLAPMTKPTKDGFKDNDVALENLFAYIVKELGVLPKDGNIPPDQKELEYFKTLLAEKRRHTENIKFSDVEHRIIKDSTVSMARADMYIEFLDMTVAIYEGKLKNPRELAPYQLEAQWDLAVEDGKKVREGVLIAESFPEWVKNAVARINKKKDASGNNYNIILRTWAEELGDQYRF